MMKRRFLHSILAISVLAVCSMDASGQSKYLQRAEKKLEKGDTVKAIKKLNKYIEKHPKDADIYLLRAKLKIDQGDYDPAMVDLNSYCSLIPTCTEASYWKGIVRYKQSDYKGAIEHLSAYTSNYKHAEAWIYLGLSHMWLQHYELAMNSFQRSLELDPTQVMAYYNAGISAFRIGRADQAVSNLSRAHELAPNDTDITLALANALTLQESFQKSIDVLQGISTNDAAYPKALYNIAVNYYRMDKESDACEWWEKAEAAGHLNAEDSIKRYCEEK